MNDYCLRPPLPLEPKKNNLKNGSPNYFNKSSCETVASTNPYLSNTSLSSYANSEFMTMSFYRDNILQNYNEKFETYPRILHIPPSITCQNDFSWGFWNWIHSKDNTLQNDVAEDKNPEDSETISYTKVFNYDGSPFKLNDAFDHHPKHFHLERNNIPTPRSEAIANQHSNPSTNEITNIDQMMFKGGTINLRNQVKRNGVNTSPSINLSSIKGLKENIVPRFYIQFMSFKGERFNNVSSICCSLEINNKKVFTGVAPCIKNNDGSVTAQFNEAFVFDVPSMEFTITVNVYGLYHKKINKSFINNVKHTLNIKNENKSIKPSYTGVFKNHHLNNNDLYLFANSITGPKNSTLTKSISIISNTFKKSNNKNSTPKNPIDNIDAVGQEIFIGDYELHFNAQQLDKTTTTYTLNPVIVPTNNNNNNNYNKKHQQSIILQTGIYWDEKVKQTISYINENIYCDYLSVQLSTTTVPIWKRYWVIFKENFLTFYDFEYKEKKEPIGKIDIHTLKSIGLPNPEYNSMPNCFCIEFEEGKDLADIVGVYQKEGDYNEKDEVEDISVKKYERIKPKEELLLKKKNVVKPSETNINTNNDISGSHSNINSNNTLYSGKKDINDDIIEEKEEEIEDSQSVIIKEDVEEKKNNENNEVNNSINNVDTSLSNTIEDMIKNISIEVNGKPIGEEKDDNNNDTSNSNSTLHQQEKIPHYEWINRVVTKSNAYFYTDSPSKLNKWINVIEESPCFQITK
ncbi:hypothetical protein BCR32DRAFT_269936 [Anaeromyces robustus]|uniref:PH domain-containing protein n=1 Tax=Anaeromyces robustus TaxID=1754192 RepID=A0A1Y1WZ23_9FUNG|nr:hypothetical protein BCR32DRAFT_269936 [Anaeromyces robustus]|eukprot:ORX78682.1 hypothetical protein BCR32DRAFT_269936 [Anaeromyces robustus]